MDVWRQRFIWPAVAAVLLLLPLFASYRMNLAHDGAWFLWAGGVILLLGALALLFCGMLRHALARAALGFILFEALALFMWARMVSFYFQGESFNDRFFFHFTAQTLATGPGNFPGLMLASIGYLLVTGMCGAVAAAHIGTAPSHRRPLVAALLLPLCLFIEPDLNLLARGSVASGMREDFTITELSGNAFGLHLEAIESRLQGVSPGKNLVLVYLESLEKVYTEESVFPGLTPFLNEMKGQGLYFGDVRQTPGANWTVAGMMASQCGTPLLTPFGPTGNDLLQVGYLNEVTCIGDLLDAAGYRQTYMGGASIRFAGKGKFYQLQGFDTIMGLEELQPRLENPAYVNNWGLYDDSMFAFALEEFGKLAAAPDTPFNLTLLTVDTHHPAGTPSVSCPRYEHIDNQILHAVHCTDFLLRGFIEGLRAHPAWDDTVVVVISDHLAMRNIAQDHYPADYERELYAVALNAGTPRAIDVKASQMDFAPTILDLLGVGHDQAFLAGDSLLDPATAARAVEFEDSQRLAMIKAVNADFFTSVTSNLCTAPPLLEIIDGNLYRKGLPMYLGVGGRRVPVENLLNRHSSITFFDDEGNVTSSITANSRNLPYLLYQGRDKNFLVLTSAEAARSLTPGVEAEEGLVVVSGQVGGPVQVLDHAPDVRDLRVDADCASLLDSTDAPGDGTGEDFLAGLCPATGEGSVYSESNGRRLVFDRVAVDNSWYSAVLERDAAGIYRIAEQEYLGLIDAAEPLEYCHAYYGNAEVLVPRIAGPTGPTTLLLERLAGTTDQFRLVHGAF